MNIYEACGPIAVVQLWICLLFLLWKWPGNRSMTYSAHAAATKQGIVYYFVIFSFHLFLLYLFITKWFVPTFRLPHIYSTILTIAIIGQLIALIVPTTGGRMTTFHDITAYSMHILLMPLSLFIVFSGSFTPIARIIAMLTAIYMVAVWVVFALKKLTSQRLLMQTIYGLSFHATLLIATFVR